MFDSVNNRAISSQSPPIIRTISANVDNGPGGGGGGGINASNHFYRATSSALPQSARLDTPPIFLNNNQRHPSHQAIPTSPLILQSVQADGKNNQTAKQKKASWPTIISGVGLKPKTSTTKPPINANASEQSSMPNEQNDSNAMVTGGVQSITVQNPIAAVAPVEPKQPAKRIIRKVPKIPEKAERVLYCLGLNNPIRRLCINIVEWKYPFQFLFFSI
ncbi:hypothetical protein QR98_0085570 [Sarcoptes scabiei]|uniref:Uncharacterized protein n=1 Tax=Sarcoptes scabiei TaxID=52283 RepID=A0A132AG97_SARSC|nr:hypothetical protein QR98_0085570 [Sarcoptes scabiei]